MQAAHFIHGNRLEALADRLIEDLHAQGTSDPMQSRRVVVAHPALGRWLQERIAQQLGIAINIEFPLPSSFVWDLLRDLEGELPRESAFSREALTWRIHHALPGIVRQPGFERVRNYLGDEGDARQRYDLALQLARGFDAYSMARPDWLRAWANRRLLLDDADERWQAELWRHLRASVAEPDRASLMQAALASLDSGKALPAQLDQGIAIFGASYLPPLMLEFLLALARHVPLRFYQPNPCLDYWGDIASEREISRRQQLWKKHGRGHAANHLEVGHPLLAAWGSLGREHLKAIHAPDLVIHDDDAFAIPDSSTLLGWLQTGILLLDAQHAEAPEPEALPSIRVHGCPGPRREVEVLHDELLGLIQSLDDLKPHEIVVMSPRIEDYAPYIAAVFGDPRDDLAIPYGISDVALRAQHPLIDAFVRLLGLTEARFTVSEVLGFLAEPAIARRQGLEGEAQDWLRTWMDESAIRWGLDAAFREKVGAAPIDENTWRFGLNRLLLGHALGNEDTALADVVPVANVEGGAAQGLGHLAAFIALLTETCAGFRQARSGGQWKHWLGTRLDLLFDSESSDPAERSALRELRNAIARLGNATQCWMGDEPIPFAVLRDALLEEINDPRKARAGRFGVTFCGMVPMRNVPYRVVCVLGLDAGKFPRQQTPPGFNLMQRHPRAGDRSIREDDRFLFLESLVAAREVFYLSHSDSGASTADADPPSLVVDELLGFLQASLGQERWLAHRERIVHRHPLQGFAPACFKPDAVTRSHDRRWCDAARELASGSKEPMPFVVFDASLPESPPARSADPGDGLVDVDIEDIMRWLRKPLRTWFQQQLPLYLHESEADEDIEPFALNHLQKYMLADRLMQAEGPRPGRHRIQREGGFPLGMAGDDDWETVNDNLDALDEALSSLPGASKPALAVDAKPIVLADLGIRVSGNICLLRGEESGLSCLLLRRPGKLRGVDLARLALERALLPHAPEARPPAFALGVEKGGAVTRQLNALPDEEAWIRSLLAWRALGLRQPIAAFPKSAQAFAESMAKNDDLAKARLAALKEWQEGDHPESADAFHALVSRHQGEALLNAQFEAFAMAVFHPLMLTGQKVKA